MLQDEAKVSLIEMLPSHLQRSTADAGLRNEDDSDCTVSKGPKMLSISLLPV
jgi:hypothetical protein